MVVGVLEVTLALVETDSLKSKRKVVRGLIDRLRHRFNVSVAEVDANDDKWRAVIGIVAVANDGPFVNSVLDTVKNAVEEAILGRAELVDSRLELIHV